MWTRVAVLRAAPRFVSLIDYDRSPGRTTLYAVTEDWALEQVAPA